MELSHSFDESCLYLALVVAYLNRDIIPRVIDLLLRSRKEDVEMYVHRGHFTE